MKTTLFDVMESEDHWSDMKGDHSYTICGLLKSFLNDLPSTFNNDSVGQLKVAYSRLERFVAALEILAEPYAEDLAEQLAADGHIDSLIDEGKECT